MIRRRTGTRILYSKHRDLTVEDASTTGSPAQSSLGDGRRAGYFQQLDKSTPTMSGYFVAPADRA
jgi:hypothetical protein